jgi:hypothetical protein
MTLSCTCPYGDDGDFDWYYDFPKDFEILDTVRRRRCKSCGDMIDVGSTVISFLRWRHAKYDSIEEKILGEGADVPLAPYYFCEPCGEIALNLHALGYCVDPESDMREDLREYQQLSGFRPRKKTPA